jgi:hypothetical protein
MTIALIVLAVIAALAIAILLVAMTRPDTFRVERSAIIDAPAGALHAILTDLRRGAEWSPFEKGLKMDKSYSGPATGPGSAMEWSNSKEVGAGRFSIVNVTPSKVTCSLVMTKPMKCNNVVEYSLAPSDNSTLMTWSMYGPTNLVTKVMGLFVSMDKMCGDQFEKGLKDLKTLAEGEATRLPGNSRSAA